jgi:7-keto-8-aminopelargonate synthetase-like enzyme
MISSLQQATEPLAVPLLSGKQIGGPASARVRIDGREYVNFYGSCYLALSGVPEIRLAVQRTLDSGTPFARNFTPVLGGIDPVFEAVERAAATACGTETSVYFASGYMIGTVGLASLEMPFDLLVLDESAHYSLKDAAKLSGLPSHTFAHCDVESLEAILRQHVHAGQRPLVMTDGVFATTGRIPPLSEYASLLAPYEGRLFLDEAHGFGVVGEQGRGAAEFCGVENIAASGATLSKAFCAQGAVVGCSVATAARLQSMPPLRGACAGSPLSAAAATASLSYVAGRPELRSELRATGDYLRSQLRRIGCEVIDTPAPIVSFRWGSRADMLALQRRVFDRGIYIYHSNYIGAGSDGLIRCSVFRDHSRQDVDALITALG